MGVMDTLAELTARALSINLSPAQRERGVGLFVAKSVKADADASDLMILANFVVTGFEMIPEPRDDPYPHASGKVTVLGPGIFSSTPDPEPGTVISWKGANFNVQPIPNPHGTEPDPTSENTEHPDDPGPEGPTGEDLPDDELDPATVEETLEPAPMAGAHWRGRRG